jgi:cytochrome P450
LSYNVESQSGLNEVLRFRRDPLEHIADAGRRSVDVRSLRIANRVIFQVNHPDLIRDVLVTHDWNFIKGRGLRASKPILGNGLLTSEGELHRRQRRLAQPAFHSARLAAYARAMVDCTLTTSAGWVSGQQYALDQEMMRLTLQIVGRTLFSADVLHDAKDIGDSLTNALRLFLSLNRPVAQLISPVRKWGEHKGARSRQKLAQVLGKVIEDHRRQPDQYDDMLSLLMSSHDDMGAGYMSDELLLDECLTLFLAGHETTANALTWTWYLLAQHPEVELRLRQEIKSALGDRPPTLEDVPLLEYTGRVFRESLRLYPPAWIIAREAVTAYRLGPLDVPPGATLFMSPYATQRDPRFWREPEQFNPDRWLEDVSASRPKFSFYPFGAGTRVCIGEHFAMMEGVLLIAVLIQRWKFHLLPNQQVDLWPQITLRPRHSIYFRWKKSKFASSLTVQLRVTHSCHLLSVKKCMEALCSAAGSLTIN